MEAVNRLSTKTHTFMTPRRVLFGLGAVEDIGREAKLLAEGKALVLTDHVVERTGLVEKVRKPLKREGFEVTVRSMAEGEPSVETADLTAEFVARGGFKIVVGVGGGSVLDIAKAASVMSKNPRGLRGYMGSQPTSTAYISVSESGLPKVLIPTTAGSGTEATRSSVLKVNGRKVSVRNDRFFADVAVVDPQMAVTMPPRLTAITGMDALSHAVESIMSLNANPLTHTLALEAVRLTARSLRQAYAYGGNLRARYDMALASLQAGLAMVNSGVVIGHLTAYSFAAMYNLPHGLACAVSLPYAMQYNIRACPGKLALIAGAMGEKPEASRAVRAVTELIEDVKLPLSLKEIGVPGDMLPRLVEETMSLYLRPGNPRKPTKQNVAELFRNMWEGRIG